jgi:hypothetical protein
LIFINKFVIPAQAGIQRTIAARAAQYLTYCRLSFYQDLRTWMSFITKCAKQIVIATARNAAGSNPEAHKTLIAMDCFVGCAASQ